MAVDWTWAPGPADLIRQADRTRWTPDNPAPDLVAYLVTWEDIRQGVPTPSRELADRLGWKRHRARKLLERVKSDLADWFAQKPDSATPKSAQPDPVITGGSPATGAQTPPPSAQKSPTVGAELTRTPTRTDNSNRKNKRAGQAQRLVQMKLVWDQVNTFRKSVVPGARALRLPEVRRKALGARIDEHGPDSVLVVVKYVLTSPARNAQWLREQGYTAPENWLSPGNFVKYLEAAEEGAASVVPDQAPADGAPSGWDDYPLD